MTDNANDKPQGGETVQPQGGTTGAAQGATETSSNAELLSKLAELERDNKKYRDERRAQETAQKKAQEEQLAAQQKYQELAQGYKERLDKLEPIAEQHEAITAAFNASLDNRLKQIPDDVRKKTVDPIRNALSPVDFSNWLDANMDILRTRPAPSLDGGAGNTATQGAQVTITPEIANLARMSGMKPEDYVKQQKAIEEQHKKNLQS